jgi:hypothetical protein
MVTDRHRGQNFFFLKEDVGKSAAERMSVNLEELNGEDVKGYFVHENISEYIKKDQSWDGKFDLVIGTQLTDSDAVAVSKKCRSMASKIPFVHIRQYGLIGSIRLDIDSQCVVEKKDQIRFKPDLRLHTPFEELAAFANNKEGEMGFDMPNLPNEKQCHVPCVVIIIQL